MRIRNNAILAYGIITALQLSARWRRASLAQIQCHPRPYVAQSHGGTVSRRRGTFFEAAASMGIPARGPARS